MRRDSTVVDWRPTHRSRPALAAQRGRSVRWLGVVLWIALALVLLGIGAR